MRLSSTLLCVLLSSGFYLANAQNPPAAPIQSQTSPEELQQKLMQILELWESDAKNLQSLYVSFAIEEKDAAFPTPKKSHGEAKLLKLEGGQYGMRLQIAEVDNQGNPIANQIKSKFICSGAWLYNFDIPQKTIYFDALKNINMKPDDGPFAFLFGMKATEATKRFRMSLVQEDQDYYWVRVEALTDQDKKDFVVAQLGVVKDAYPNCPKGFPAQIMYREPNNNLKTWIFKQVIRNDLTKVSMTDFSVEEEKKAGWKLLPAIKQSNNNAGGGTGQVVPASGTVPPGRSP